MTSPSLARIKAFIDELTTHKVQVEGTGPITYHLGCDYFRDADGTLCTALRYIEKMVEAYERMFGCNLSRTFGPREGELDDSDLPGMDDIKKYQSMIGATMGVTIGA
jgi:hypothetical protein